jgi:hypothetical protein
MEKALSARNECVRGERRDDDGQLIPPAAGVVLRGMDDDVVLSDDEAYRLAAKYQAKWPDLAKQLEEAASGVIFTTRFDGPLGYCDIVGARPGNYEKAERMISNLEDV